MLKRLTVYVSDLNRYAPLIDQVPGGSCGASRRIRRAPWSRSNAYSTI
jgi:hypothetical protein